MHMSLLIYDSKYPQNTAHNLLQHVKKNESKNDICVGTSHDVENDEEPVLFPLLKAVTIVSDSHADVFKVLVVLLVLPVMFCGCLICFEVPEMT
jgi:hypothetical protein